MKGYSLPLGFGKDIERFEKLVDKCQKREISPAELKAHRVPFGVYEQREADTYMVRIRCAAGYISPAQLSKVAELSRLYGRDQLHLTTRQEIQIHYVKLDKIVAIIKALAKVGLASRGGGGNTIRNIIVQEDAGVDPEEVFDVTPYAIALTTRLISESDSWTLPRKLKIAFSGSQADKGHATLNDLGFIAQIKAGQKGFRVYLAGGMGAKSSEGHLFFDFIPETEVYNVSKAVKNLFWKNGNRKNKHAARLRFLWQSLGEEEFRKRFNAEYTLVKEEKHPQLKIKEITNAGIDPKIEALQLVESADFSLWRSRFVCVQKQEAIFSVLVPIELGFIENEKVASLAKFLAAFGDNVISLGKDQNFYLRNIPEKYLFNIYKFLKENLSNFNRPVIYDKLISCAGASTCQLGICLSRGAARAIMRSLSQSNIDLDKIGNLKIKISGCPNACGQHPTADLGFFGKANRNQDQLYPAYNVVSGAVIAAGKTKFSQKVGEVSAKDLPRLVKDFLEGYITKISQYKNFQDYVQQQGKDDLETLCSKYSQIPDFKEDKNYYYDWETDEVFSLAGRGIGECSAGLFDLIDLDLKNIRGTKSELAKVSDAAAKDKLLLALTFYASRMLLITRGLEPKTEKETYQGFFEHFIDAGLVDSSFKEIVKAAENKNYSILLNNQEKIYQLAQRVEFLYDKMDNAFQFKVESAQPADLIRKAPQASESKVVKDFRGVACPMNFVKTKIELVKLQSKELLEVLLDDGEPIDNVPGSVKAEGHKIIAQKKVDNYWSLLIEKK